MTGKEIIGVLLITVVVVVSELALRRHRRTMAQLQYLRQHGRTAMGTIVDTQRVKNSKSAPVMLYAKISYEVQGTERSIANTWPITEQLRLVKGSPIEVFYDPAQPSNACVSDAAAPDTGKYGKSVRVLELAAVVILAIITIIAGR